MDASDYQEIRQLFDDYLRMYSSRDDQLTTRFSDDFSGFTGGGDFLVKDREGWIAITLQDFAQIKDPIHIELKDLAIQSLADTIAVATGFFTIQLPIEDHILSRETARLVLIFRKESAGWKISHSSISIPYHLVGEGEVYPLKELVERNQILEELIAERTIQLSDAKDNLQQTNEELAREITEHKQMEMELRKSEGMFSTVFRMSPDAININRISDGMFLEINEGFTAITGYTSDDVIDRTSLELNIWVNPEDRAHLVNELREQGVVNNFEAQFRRKDGSTLTGFMSARIVEIGGESCLLSIFRDISERKRTEEYLRESKNNLRTLMDSMPAGVWWFDKDGNVEYLNRGFVKQFGYSLDDIPTLNDWFVRAYPDSKLRGPYIAARGLSIAKAWNSGTAVPPREVKITCKDGTQRHIIINTQFALGRVIEIFTDITAREHFNDQLQKMEKLESLGVLAGGIAHDFNNILTGVIGNISFARTFLDKSHKSTTILLNAEKAANRAADLAHQLLTFAKGGQPIKKTVSMQHILEESASFVLRGSNVSSDINLPVDLPAVEVDEGQISQVINNIIIDASHAMPGGGTIIIRGENVTVDAANIMSLAPGDYIKLTVTDTGCGISDEDQKKIFDPYFTTKPGGSGLGLASAHSIVTKHGGCISVRSVVGIGTTFELLLPASDKKVTLDDVGATSVTIGGRHAFSVLVMDDDEIIRDMLTHMMNDLGYHAQTCANGEESIALYKAAMDVGSPCSAVIMDLIVPGGMGGREAAEHVLTIDPNARLIVSSGYSTDPIMADFSKYGFCATLLKPYSIEEISRTLTSVFSTESIPIR